MKKKILALILAAAMTASLAACGGNDNTVDTGDDTSVDTSASVKDVSIEELHTAIKDAYGEGYVPNMPIDAEMLASIYGIEAGWVEEFVAEMPMIMTHVDTLIIVKPTEGNTENVLDALNSYYDYLNNDSMQYPMNIEKVRAAQVFEKGGYVFFIMLGMMSDEALYAEGTEEEIAKIQYDEAVANNKKAIDAIDAAFGA